MTTTDLPSRTAEASTRHAACPLSQDPTRPPGTEPVPPQADSTLCDATRTTTSPRVQCNARPLARRPRRPSVPTAPTGAGQALERRTLRNADTRARQSWDRMRFLPALPEDTALDECDVVAMSSIHESRRRAAGQRPPDPVRTAQAVVTAAAEVLAGWRPADHLGRWTSPELYDALARRAGLARRILGEAPAPRPRARTIRVQLTVSGACEVCAVLDDGVRVRGAGARFELHRGRWLLTNLEIA